MKSILVDRDKATSGMLLPWPNSLVARLLLMLLSDSDGVDLHSVLRCSDFVSRPRQAIAVFPKGHSIDMA